MRIFGQHGTTGIKRLVMKATYTPTEPMTDTDQPLTPDRLPDLLDEGTHEEVVAYPDRLDAAET